MAIVGDVTTTLFTMTNTGIDIFDEGIAWFTLRVSHTKIKLIEAQVLDIRTSVAFFDQK